MSFADGDTTSRPVDGTTSVVARVGGAVVPSHVATSPAPEASAVHFQFIKNLRHVSTQPRIRIASTPHAGDLAELPCYDSPCTLFRSRIPSSERHSHRTP